MTANWVIYRQDNGEILPKSYSGRNVAAQLRDGEAAVQGDASWKTHRVVGGKIVALSGPRVAPSEFASWSPELAQWVDARTEQQKLDDQWDAIRKQRNALLAASDWVAIRQAEQGGPLSPAWRNYRQALRDITLQADPFNITWPTAPQ